MTRITFRAQIPAALALVAAALLFGAHLRAQDSSEATSATATAMAASPGDGVLRPILEQFLDDLSRKPLADWYSPLPSDRNASVGAFQHAIEKARRQGDAAACLRLSLRSLAAHGTGGNFPRRLWEAAGYADWAERKFGQRTVDPGVCSGLLSVCDELPPRQAYFLEGRFLRAKRLARSGDLAGEQAILNQVVATPNLSLDFLAPACRMLGASLEVSGDYRGALDTYDLLEAAADRYGAAADCMLGAVLINLRLGNNDEAIRLIRILQQAPPEVIRGATGAVQIRELVALVDSGQTERLALARPIHSIEPQIQAQSSPGSLIARWILLNSLGWYEYAGPESMDMVRAREGQSAVRQPEALLKAAEQIKLLLLTAQDMQAPAERRLGSFREAVRRILNAVPDYRRFNAVADSVIDNPEFDGETRRLTLESALAVLAGEGRRGDYDAWRKNPLAKTFNAEFQGKLAVLDQEASLDRTSSPAILRMADTIRAKPMTSFDALTMGDLLGFLLRLGDLQAAGSLAATIPSWALDAGASLQADGVQSDFAQRIQKANSVNPVHEALAQALRADFSEVPGQLPAEFRDLRIDAGLPARGPESTFQACRFLVEDRQFGRDNFEFWGTLLRALPQQDNQPAIVADLLRAGLRAASGDGIRSQLIALFFTSVDVDNPDMRRAIEGEFAPYRQPAEFPQSAFAIRLYEVQRDLRLGVPVALDTAFSDLDDPRAGIVEAMEGIRMYTQTRDLDALRRTVGRMGPVRLLDPAFVAQTIPAYRLLGIEPGLALEAARRALRDAILDSWLRHDDSSGGTALDLALAIDDPAALPSAWVREMGAGPGDPLFQGRVRLVSAFLNRNWARLEAEAAELNRAYPTSYSYYWYRGLALHQLGRDGEAVAPLATYVLHARDELDYPKAIEILQSLGQPVPQ